MPHPDGSKGGVFPARHTFAQTFAAVGRAGMQFVSTTGERITARQGVTRDGATQTIEFDGQHGHIGKVCAACWGFRESCSGTRIGQCTEALDQSVL